MIFTCDFVTRGNWQIISLVTKKIIIHGNSCIILYISQWLRQYGDPIANVLELLQPHSKPLDWSWTLSSHVTNPVSLEEAPYSLGTGVHICPQETDTVWHVVIPPKVMYRNCGNYKQEEWDQHASPEGHFANMDWFHSRYGWIITSIMNSRYGWIITSIMKCGIKLLIHSPKSTVRSTL